MANQFPPVEGEGAIPLPSGKGLFDYALASQFPPTRGEGGNSLHYW